MVFPSGRGGTLADLVIFCAMTRALSHAHDLQLRRAYGKNIK
jgi:hypothetical protein